MSIERIFWLDDSPNFFDRMEDVAQSANLPLDLPALIRRTTFAFDFEMGVAALEEEFDLYILDGDFPNRVNDARRAGLEAYLEKVRAGPVNHWKEYPRNGDHEGNVHNNGFLFYQQQRPKIPSDKKVLVHSMSEPAQVLAYLFDLPIYVKGEPIAGMRTVPEQIKKDFREWYFERIPGAWERFLAKNGIQNSNELCVSPYADLTGYEYGARKELIERYLL